MTPKGERNVGMPLAAAGVGIIGVAILFGLTTDGGDIDWVGVVTATAGLVMIVTGLYRALRKDKPHGA